jgi:predicted aspartyl protease
MCVAVVSATDGAAVASPSPSLASVLARYVRAMSDPGVPKLENYEASGTIAGAGLSGTYHEWDAGDRHRTDANLGPRTQRTLQIGDRFYVADENGIARQLTGVLQRRSLTQALIESGDFANRPERCALRAPEVIDGQAVDVIDVTAPGGDTETLALSAATGLPVRIAYDDDDSRTTIAFADWRSIEGYRFPFKTVTSDGDSAFDTTQTTTQIAIGKPIEASIFAPLVSRRIEMDDTDTVPLTFRDGHLYVSARVDGHAYTFLVDTGAQNIVLDKHVAQELHLPGLGDFEASGAKRTGGLQIVSVDAFAIGSGTLRHLVVATIDLHGSTSGAFAIDGILGYPFFASALVKIDIAGRTMTFGAPGSFVPAGERLAVDVDRSIPEVRLRLNGNVDAPFIVDTGNAADILLYKPFVDHHAGIVPYSTTTRNSYGIGGAAASYRTSLDELDIGSNPIYRADTDVMQATSGAFADRFDAGNVGLGLLQNFVLTFDLSNNALFVERSSTYDDGRSRN